MKLEFLGTSAANAYPEAFCRCANCLEARRRGGRDLRKRSAAIVNGDLLLDMGPDVMASSQAHGISLTGVRFCLQTHFHADHMDLSHLLSRSPGYGTVGAPRLVLCASRETIRRADETFRRDMADFGLLDPGAGRELNLELRVLEPMEPAALGPYRVTAFPANHAPGSGAFLYAVEEGGSALFYGLDTAALFEETWRAFRELGMRFDLVVLDHTYGPGRSEGDHLDASLVAAYAERLRGEGLLKDKGRVFGTHLFHASNPCHEELSRWASSHGYEIAHDGLTIEA